MLAQTKHYVVLFPQDTQSSFSNKTSQLTDGDYYATLANRDGSCEDLKEYARDARANLHEVSDEISAVSITKGFTKGSTNVLTKAYKRVFS
jgi:hypothetical protein